MAYIVLAYILCMAVMPSMGVTSSEVETSCCADMCGEEDGGEESEKDCDVCNPLFSCACYSGFLVNYHSFTLGTYHSMVSGNAVYVPSSVLQLSYSIWQPPKLTA